MRIEDLVDKISAQSWVDRMPLLPARLILTFGIVIAINSAVSLLSDQYESPWWLTFPLLIAFFLLLFRAARAEKTAKATGTAK